MSARIASSGTAIALLFVFAGCEGGGVPNGIPRVRTGGGAKVTEMESASVSSASTSQNNGATNAANNGGVSQGGSVPNAGTGNDLTGGGGFEARADDDFIGLDELDDFDDFADVEGFDELDDFGAGFAVPPLAGSGAGGAGGT